MAPGGLEFGRTGIDGPLEREIGRRCDAPSLKAVRLGSEFVGREHRGRFEQNCVRKAFHWHNDMLIGEFTVLVSRPGVIGLPSCDPAAIA